MKKIKAGSKVLIKTGPHTGIQGVVTTVITINYRNRYCVELPTGETTMFFYKHLSIVKS